MTSNRTYHPNFGDDKESTTYNNTQQQMTEQYDIAPIGGMILALRDSRRAKSSASEQDARPNKARPIECTDSSSKEVSQLTKVNAYNTKQCKS